MRRETDRVKSFTRRTVMLAGVQGLLLSAVVARMYQLQVLRSDRYTMLADENRINLRLLPPPRGRIVDRFGTPLAVNRQNYRVVLVAEKTRDAAATLDALARIVRLRDSDRSRVLRAVDRTRSFAPIVVREDLSWAEVSRIEVNAPDLPGLSIEVGRTRSYPYGEAAAHVLGYVAAVSPDELTGDPLLELPDFRIGKQGIEKQYDQVLRGRAGTSQLEVNAVGRVIRELARQEGRPGREVVLSLDLGLQQFVKRRFSGESGAAVVLDIETGDVLAMASTPGFDPNQFSGGMTAAAWKALTSDERMPLSNKAASGQYSPGSTFKMMVVLAALENEVATPRQKYLCTGNLELGGQVFHCWKRSGHGWLDMRQAVEQSCDVYFYELARRVGIDRIAAMARRFGLGSVLGLDLPGEKPGLIPDREWKLATKGISWKVGETLISGIGQGYVLTTPLQLAVMTARLANGGKAVIPRLTRAYAEAGKVYPVTAKEPQPMGIGPSGLAFVVDAMNGVVNRWQGTAYKARIEAEGFEMGGKTGTVQVRRITEQERAQGLRKRSELPWRQRDHALFVGFAPVRAPRYAASIVVEHGGGGSSVAAPIARDVLLETQRRDPSRVPVARRGSKKGVG